MLEKVRARGREKYYCRAYITIGTMKIILFLDYIHRQFKV